MGSHLQNLQSNVYTRIDPSECLILEDNEHGIAAANASGEAFNENQHTRRCQI